MYVKAYRYVARSVAVVSTDEHHSSKRDSPMWCFGAGLLVKLNVAFHCLLELTSKNYPPT